MSFVTAIRDYVETLTILSDSFGQNVTLSSFLSQTFWYVFQTLQQGLLYIVSFQWIRDFTLLPIVLPQFTSALFKETFFLETPSRVLFEFLEIPDLHQNKFLLGFFNSLFFSLPLSVVHILSLRRLLIQGIPAGVYSISGYLVGQLLFLGATLFGLRNILVPWLTLEPFNYFLGVILIFRLLYSMARENLVELKGWFLPQYSTFFVTSLLLAWCEQTSVFQYLGNLTLSSHGTLLESFSSTSSLSSFLTHFLYLLGITVGSLFFTGLWGLCFLQLKNWIIFYTPLFTSTFLQWINKSSFVLALALSLTSIPFYGFEYLATGPLGFVSRDSVFRNTLLDQMPIKDYAKGTTGVSSQESLFQYIDLETSPFDRGEYLTATDVLQPLSFEDLNYRGEFDWTRRNAKLSGITDSRGGFFTLSKLFKKQKKTQVDTSKSASAILDKNQLLPKTTTQKTEFFEQAPNEKGTNSEIINRYVQFYDGNTESLDSFQIPYQQLASSSFPADFVRKSSKIQSRIEQKIKDKYYSNPVYKSLLALDIDFFLRRQPPEFKLQAEQELDLSTKRKMLQSYCNSLRGYSRLPYSETFDSFFDGAKSFSNKVYNQQFKGTLRSVRRLFTLHIDEKDIASVLKFDQPLYQFSETPSFSPYHEELSDENLSTGTFGIGGIGSKNEISEKGTTSFFLNQPLYAGWDEHLRKFVITNKFLPRTLAGYKVNLLQKKENSSAAEQLTNKNQQPGSQKNVLSSPGQKIKFTVWPFSKNQLDVKNQASIPYVTLYYPLDKRAKESFGEQDFVTLPGNLEKWEFQQSLNEKGKKQLLKQPSLIPKRGGFVWPGTGTYKLPQQSFSRFFPQK